MKNLLLILLVAPLFGFSQVKISVMFDIGMGGHLGQVVTKSKMGNQIFLSEQGNWKAPYSGFSIAPGIVYKNFLAAPGLSINYQARSTKDNNREAFVEYDFFIMLRQRIGQGKVKPLIDFKMGYASVRYTGGTLPPGVYVSDDIWKRHGLFIEPGIGVSFSEHPSINIKLCYRYENLKHNYRAAMTDSFGNPIGYSESWDYLNYILVKIGFQLN